MFDSLAAGVFMRLAVVGKGGVGKTALVALVARSFAERGLKVLAVDLDFNPGLAVSFGLDPSDTPFPQEAIEEQADAPYGWAMAGHLTPAETVRRHGTRVTDRIVYLGFGNVAHVVSPLRRYITAVRQVAEGFREPGWVVILDIGAGPTGVFEGYAHTADLVLVLAEPTVASAVAAERIVALLSHDGTAARLVLTKCRNGPGAGNSRDVPPIAIVPFDPEVRRLERSGSLATLSDDSPALGAVRQLVADLELR